MSPSKFAVGTRVKLTGDFLRNTGQQAGGEGTREWSIVACDCPACREGRWVAVDEPDSCEPWRSRHIATGNLMKAH